MTVTLEEGTEHERSLETLDSISKKREQPPLHARPYRPRIRRTVKLMIVFEEHILMQIEASAKEKGVSIQEEIRQLVAEAIGFKGKQE